MRSHATRRQSRDVLNIFNLEFSEMDEPLSSNGCPRLLRSAINARQQPYEGQMEYMLTEITEVERSL